MVLRLADAASVIRSKNAGPYELTLDIVFRTREAYRAIVDGNCLTPALIADLYRLPVADVLEFVRFEPVSAIKITFRDRWLPATWGRPMSTEPSNMARCSTWSSTFRSSMRRRGEC